MIRGVRVVLVTTRGLVREPSPCIPQPHPRHQAGGRASDGKRRVLGIQPAALHERLPLFLGSRDDIAELESYGDVQQGGGKTYDV